MIGHETICMYVGQVFPYLAEMQGDLKHWLASDTRERVGNVGDQTLVIDCFSGCCTGSLYTLQQSTLCCALCTKYSKSHFCCMIQTVPLLASAFVQRI